MRTISFAFNTKISSKENAEKFLKSKNLEIIRVRNDGISVRVPLDVINEITNHISEDEDGRYLKIDLNPEYSSHFLFGEMVNKK